MMDYDYTHHSLLQYYQYSNFYLLLNFLFLRKYVSTFNKQLNSENVLFCRDGHLSTILFICLVLFIYLVQFRKRV